VRNDLIYGLHAATIFLQKKGKQVQTIYLLNDKDDKRISSIKKLARKYDLKIAYVDKQELSRLVGEVKHQGVVLEVSATKSQGENELLTLVDTIENPFLLILDGVQDPHNLGACLRSADAAGVHAVIIPKDKSTGITPAVRKVASGAAESVPFFQVTNLARVMKELKERNIWLVGAAGEADDTIYKVDLKGGLAIVAGAEGDGMRRLTKEHCDFLVKIPMHGVVSSLNVSVATGILLFEAVRQRSK